MIAIIDYGMGNLYSVEKALQKVGAQTQIVTSPDGLQDAEAMVLPGVGAFSQGMENLHARGLVDAIRERVAAGVPLLGICLGLELLFQESEEMGRHKGLGFLAGQVKRFDIPLVVPHMGWNQLRPRRDTFLLEGVPPGSYVYFVHSYYAEPDDPNLVLATTEYGIEFASVIGREHILGLQFHPEKSQQVGLRILHNFCRWLSARTGTSHGEARDHLSGN